MGQHSTPGEQPARRMGGTTVMLITAAVVLLALITAAVVLSVAGKSEAEIAGILVGLSAVAVTVLGAMQRLGVVADETRHQTELLQVIDERTNGNLDRRIQTAVHAVLNARYGTPDARTVHEGQSTRDRVDDGPETRAA